MTGSTYRYDLVSQRSTFHGVVAHSSSQLPPFPMGREKAIGVGLGKSGYEAEVEAVMYHHVKILSAVIVGAMGIREALCSRAG